jgi:hypothetical protein
VKPDDELLEGTEGTEGSEIIEKPKRWWRKAYLWYLAAFVVFVALALPVFSTLQPGYYDRYPDLRLPMDEWKTSTHGLMSCGSCHIEPGVAGFARFAAQSIPAFYSQLVSGPSTSNLLKAPSAAACQKCHTSYRSVSPNGDLRIPHAWHVQKIYVNCSTCHKNLVHHKNPLGINRPSMTRCYQQCHDGVKATQECKDCHLRKTVPDSHKKPNWSEVHRDESKKSDCGECHGWTPDYCSECHKDRPSSHDGNWKKLHSVKAAQNSNGCFFCHKPAFCNKCHYGLTQQAKSN